MNAVKIYPSSPIIFAKGSKKFATIVNRLFPSIPMFANIHMINPAGAADTIALP